MADGDQEPQGEGCGGSCQLCPVCLLLGGGLGARPEVREHLRAAGRELALALRAALEGMSGDAPAPGEDPAAGLRRVDLDDLDDAGDPHDRG